MTNRNKHLHHLNYLTLGVLLLGGCVSSEESFDDPSVLTDGGSFDTADELESDEQAVPRSLVDGLDLECAELLGPVIARIEPNDIGAYVCSFPGMPSSWTATPLFSNGSPWMQAQILARPLPSDSPLHRYCKYDYVGKNPGDPIADYEQLFSNGRPYFDGLPATDCPSVTGQGGLDNPDIIGASSDAFMDAVDAIDGSELEDLELGTVHTYLLDTKQANIDAYDQHAEHLRKMLEDLACADDRPGCLSGIHEILVAPLRAEEDFATSHWGANNENVAGGTHGYVHQTALGIAIAVLDWQDQNDDNDPTTLERGVINLSMGAVPSSSFASNTAYATAQAVLDTMRMAACYDMPIFVAAGNRDIADAECDDPGEGLLLPAVYESIVMPTATECQTWGYVPDWDTSLFPRSIVSEALDRPLAAAISAVDHEDRLLSTNRLGATTFLAAPGLGAVTSGTTPLTGTSVSTLVATAGANLLWSADPGLRSRDMIGVLYNTGWDTGLTAEAGWFMNSPVNRVSLCAALDNLVGELDCLASAPSSNPTAAIGTATLSTVTQAQLLGQLVSFISQDPGTVPACGQVPLGLMIPQPQRPYCANCSVGKGAAHTLYMTISPESWSASMTVASAILYVTDAADVTTSYTLDTSVRTQINAMNPANVIAVQFSHPSPVSASLQFTYTGASGPLTVNNPLVVW